MLSNKSFKYHKAPTIADRVALGRKLNRAEKGAIVPFPEGWNETQLRASFRSGADFLIHNLRGEGYEATTLHLYVDDDGQKIGGVLRLEHPDKGKQVLPVRATEITIRNPNLEVKALDPPRPLYGLDKLARNPAMPVIVFEGEKTADAGQQLFTNHVVLTWHGGTGGVASADWRPLSGRNVIIWPDNDKPGRDAAEAIAELLADVDAASVRIVQVPAHFPAKWDVADDVPEPADA